jgi:GDSL-like Lipase/Acylhydrolase family
MTHEHQSTTVPTAPRRSARRRLKYAAMLLLIGLLAAELFARFYLGLGDPPLSETHPTIEYWFVPNQHVRRFGNRFETNSYSMRSAEFPKHKQDPRELRILVLGDSIINGGTLTDQDDLATELLRRDLIERLDRPVVVGNISAGSWGPPNLLAYVKEFGTFDADIAVLVFSSHDAADVPTFAPLDPNSLPQSKPPCALWEAITRYLPRYVHGFTHVPDEPPPTAVDKAEDVALDAVESLIKVFQRAGASVVVLQHQSLSELRSRPEPGHAALANACRQAGVQPIQLGPRFIQSVDDGIDPYREDGLHPNTTGQRLIYEALREAVLNTVKSMRASDKSALRTDRFEISPQASCHARTTSHILRRYRGAHLHERAMILSQASLLRAC